MILFGKMNFAQRCQINCRFITYDKITTLFINSMWDFIKSYTLVLKGGFLYVPRIRNITERFRGIQNESKSNVIFLHVFCNQANKQTTVPGDVTPD